MKTHFALAITLLATFASSCGPSGRNGTSTGDDDDDGGGGGDGSNRLPDGALIGSSCSSDLHEVLDGNGNVIMTCPDDQGCAAGVCVDACAAAAASQGSVGCDFEVATPSFYPTIAPPCFAVFLANNWPTDAGVSITESGTPYDVTTFARIPDGTVNAAGWAAVPATGIPSSNVGVLFLSQDPSSFNGNNALTCPVSPAINQSGGAAVWTQSASASGIGNAWHITTTRPVSAYDIYPYGGAGSYLPSAELLFPTSAWGTNYVTGNPAPTQGSGWGQVTAMTDGTTVMITPTTNLPGGTGVAATSAGQTGSYTLNAGQFIQWQDAGDMAGSVISSSAPVSYTGGTTYLCLSDSTSSGGGCDSGHQDTPPVSALGSEYVVPPYATRQADLSEESIVYRFVGAVDGTQLTYDPPNAGPTTLNSGQVVQFEATGAFKVTSQDAMHPFYIGQYMTGCFTSSGSRDGASDQDGNCLGDEEYVDIVPPAQWLSSYVFFTDPTYTTTNLVVVRKADANGQFSDVTIDCLGVIGNWQAVGSSNQYQITNVDLQRINPVGSCTNGRHTASSTGGAFTIMVWGLSTFSSYAYPAGGNVGKINSVVVIGRETH